MSLKELIEDQRGQMLGLGPWEIALIFGVIMLLFGPKKLPELAKAVGKAVRQYRETSEGVWFEKRVSAERLTEVAKKLGIDVEGKEPDEIAEELAKLVEKTQKPKKAKPKT